MTLEQLRIFIAVATREHVTRAAEALNLTPSSVSQAVTGLETELGLALFSRVGRHIELTEPGRIFLDEARAVLARASAARQRMEDLGDLRSGLLPVRASQTIASYWLPARLNAFQDRYPGIEIRMMTGNTAEVCQSVQDGTVSVGLVEGELLRPDLIFSEVARDQMILVTSPRHPWATTPPTLADLPASNWILRETGSGTRSEFEEALTHAGLDPKSLPVRMELPSNEAVASAIETGHAASVLSASVVAGKLDAGLLCHIPFPLPERRFSLVRHRSRHTSPAETAFIRLLRNMT
ncbi:LysR family transcriptional regulator [Acetobacter oeni]|nr:LysR family transcriptional regulator [Acetobacter oeni]MBB3882433.1 DNA-binding transcriptional LysR family regulator [Acetobacter oeni]NHO18473.1 LysR family transcriptional regulator [Acetobacter oeni]